MTIIAGLDLPEAERKIEKAHPGWHLWHSKDGEGPGREYATSTATDPQDSLACGITLDAPSVERIEEVIGKYEHEHPVRSAA